MRDFVGLQRRFYCSRKPATDEHLHRYADLRISLSLDGGVMKNYGKFRDLLANMKDTTDGKDEELFLGIQQ